MENSYDEMKRRAEDAERRLSETHELAERLSKELEREKRDTELRTSRLIKAKEDAEIHAKEILDLSRMEIRDMKRVLRREEQRSSLLEEEMKKMFENNAVELEKSIRNEAMVAIEEFKKHVFQEVQDHDREKELARQEELEELRIHDELEKDRRSQMMRKRIETKNHQQHQNQLRVTRADRREDEHVDVALGQLRDFIKSQKLPRERRRQ